MKPLVLLFIILVLVIAPVGAEKPLWSKRGVYRPISLGNEGVGSTKPISVISPDGRRELHIDWQRGPDGDATAVATLNSAWGHTSIPLNEDCAQIEVLWSTNSSDIGLTCGITVITNSTAIYQVSDSGIQAMPLKHLYEDMARTYPPCKARNADLSNCNLVARGDQFNYATVAWADAHTAVVMAEVPCSSSWGGIMCQVEGYEVDARTGKIMRRMTARQLKARWQREIAFSVRVPDAPIWVTSH